MQNCSRANISICIPVVLHLPMTHELKRCCRLSIRCPRAAHIRGRNSASRCGNRSTSRMSLFAGNCPIAPHRHQIFRRLSGHCLSARRHTAQRCLVLLVLQTNKYIEICSIPYNRGCYSLRSPSLRFLLPTTFWGGSSNLISLHALILNFRQPSQF